MTLSTSMVQQTAFQLRKMNDQATSAIKDPSSLKSLHTKTLRGKGQEDILEMRIAANLAKKKAAAIEMQASKRAADEIKRIEAGEKLPDDRGAWKDRLMSFFGKKEQIGELKATGICAHGRQELVCVVCKRERKQQESDDSLSVEEPQIHTITGVVQVDGARAGDEQPSSEIIDEIQSYTQDKWQAGKSGEDSTLHDLHGTNGAKGSLTNQVVTSDEGGNNYDSRSGKLKFKKPHIIGKPVKIKEPDSSDLNMESKFELGNNSAESRSIPETQEELEYESTKDLRSKQGFTSTPSFSTAVSVESSQSARNHNGKKIEKFKIYRKVNKDEADITSQVMSILGQAPHAPYEVETKIVHKKTTEIQLDRPEPEVIEGYMVIYLFSHTVCCFSLLLSYLI